jgi:hypothetical protein
MRARKPVGVGILRKAESAARPNCGKLQSMRRASLTDKSVSGWGAFPYRQRPRPLAHRLALI